MPINQSAISLCGWHLKISAGGFQVHRQDRLIASCRCWSEFWERSCQSLRLVGAPVAHHVR
jgi:hypothetical protein